MASASSDDSSSGSETDVQDERAPEIVPSVAEGQSAPLNDLSLPHDSVNTAMDVTVPASKPEQSATAVEKAPTDVFVAPNWLIAGPINVNSRLPLVHPRDEEYIQFRRHGCYWCWLCDVTLSKDEMSRHTVEQQHLRNVDVFTYDQYSSSKLLYQVKADECKRRWPKAKDCQELSVRQWEAERHREKYPDDYRK